MGVGSKVSNGIKWQSLNFGIKAILNIIYISLITRILGADIFGEYAILSIILMFSVVLTEAGFGAAIVHFADKSNELVSTAIFCSLIFNFFLIFIVTLTSPFIVSLFDNDINPNGIIVIVFGSVFLSISTIYQSCFMLIYDFRSIAIASLFSFIVGNFFISIPLAMYGLGIWSIIIGLVFKYVLNLLLLHIQSDFSFTLTLNRSHFKKIINYSYGLIINRIFKGVSTQFDKVFIGMYYPISMLGFYERGITITNLPKSFTGSSLDGVFFTWFSHNKNNKISLKTTYTSSICLISFGLFFIGFIFLFHSEFIISVLFGSRWLECSDILKILSLSIFFFPYSRFVDTLVRATKFFTPALFLQVIKFVSLVSFSYIGNLYFGINGLIFGIIFSEFIYTFTSILLSNYILRLTFKDFLLTQRFAFYYFCLLFILHISVGSTSITIGYKFTISFFSCLIITVLLIYLKPSLFGINNMQILYKLTGNRPNIPLVSWFMEKLYKRL